MELVWWCGGVGLEWVVCDCPGNGLDNLYVLRAGLWCGSVGE